MTNPLRIVGWLVPNADGTFSGTFYSWHSDAVAAVRGAGSMAGAARSLSGAGGLSAGAGTAPASDGEIVSAVGMLPEAPSGA